MYDWFTLTLPRTHKKNGSCLRKAYPLEDQVREVMPAFTGYRQSNPLQIEAEWRLIFYVYKRSEQERTLAKKDWTERIVNWILFDK